MTEHEHNLMDEEVLAPEQAEPEAEAAMPDAMEAEELPEAVETEEPAEKSADEASAEVVEDDDECGEAEEPEETDETAEGEASTETERKLNVKKLALTIVAVVLAAALIGVGAFFGGRYLKQKHLEKNGFVAFPSAESDAALATYSCYTYKETEKAEKYRDLVVARLGDYELKNPQLDVFYWSQYFNFMSSYGSYASYYGLDTTKPLDVQTSMDGGTWEQAFLNDALEVFHQYAAMSAEAESQGFELTQQEEDYLASLPEEMETAVLEYGYANVEDYLKRSFGAAVTLEDYATYARYYATAMAYAAELNNGVTCTDEEVEAYFDANAETYAANGISKLDKPVVNVRHILLQPEMDLDTDDDGTMDDYSVEAWAAAEAEAEKLLAEWEKDPTEDNFAAMADAHSTDPGSNTNGGLYEGVYPGQMVPAFNDWCFADERAVGDTGIVKTDYGYHIMFYSGVGDTIYWQTVAREDCINTKFNEMVTGILEKWPLEVNFHNVHLFDIVTFNNNLVAEAAAAPAAEPEASAEDTAEAPAAEE